MRVSHNEARPATFNGSILLIATESILVIPDVGADEPMTRHALSGLVPVCSSMVGFLRGHDHMSFSPA